MKTERKQRRCRVTLGSWLIAMAALATLGSCSNDEAGGELLPDGKYPMTLNTELGGLAATRATTEGQWSASDAIAVQDGTETRQYHPGTGGSTTLSAATGVTPFFWKTTTETKSIRAWCCGTGYRETRPASWAVQPDQSADGYQKSDFLYAPVILIPFSDRNTVSLPFYHQTAKVVINILNQEAITDVAAIKSVVVGNANLALSGTYTQPTTGSTGTWTTTATTTKGTVTPKDNTTSGSTYLKTYAALVIPQNMNGQRFIAVTLTNNNTYYYTPATEANLEAGKEYTYNIMVKKAGLTVTAIGAEPWGAGPTIHVTGKEVVADYTASDLKIGDYYYSDGTWSDGGYRKYTDDEVVTLPIMPVLKDASGKARTVIGIVFKVGKDVDGSWKDNCVYYQKGTATPMSTIRGYVLGLYDANSGSPAAWGPLNMQVGTNTEENAGFYGYTNTNIIKAFATQHNLTVQTDFPATYYATDGYEANYPAPAGSSGWFLPSDGQGQYWLNNKAVLLASVKKATGNDNYDWQYYYWSSSECGDNPAINVWNVNLNSIMSSDPKNSSYDHYVRSIFAF